MCVFKNRRWVPQFLADGQKQTYLSPCGFGPNNKKRNASRMLKSNSVGYKEVRSTRFFQYILKGKLIDRS